MTGATDIGPRGDGRSSKGRGGVTVAMSDRDIGQDPGQDIGSRARVLLGQRDVHARSNRRKCDERSI